MGELRPKNESPEPFSGLFRCHSTDPGLFALRAVERHRHTVTLNRVLIRVYELATELAIPTKQLMAELTRRGDFVRSAASTLSPEIARSIRAAHGITTPPPRRPVARPGTPRPRSSVPLDDPADHDYTMTTQEAAEEFEVSAATIRQWVRRGHLRAAGSQGRAQVYRHSDLERARAATRSSTRRTPPPRPTPHGLALRPISTAEAAAVIGVAPSTIRMWVHRGLLRPLPDRGRGHRFDLTDVLRTARRWRRH